MAEWAPRLLLIITTLLVFAPVCTHDFVDWDDNLNVTKNPFLNPVSVSTLARFWQEPYINLYIPVTYTAWGLLAAIATMPMPDSHGITLNPYIFHVTNLLIHVGAVLAVYGLLRRLVGARWPAAAGAMLFAIHPMQVEPVAWVTGLKDVLCGALSLFSLYQYVCFAQLEPNGNPRRRAVHYGLAVAAFVLALLSKPSAVTVPVAAFVIDWWLLRRPFRKALVGIAPLMLVGVACAILSVLVQSTTATADGGHVLLRPLIATDALAFYFYKFAYPVSLGFHYDRNPLRVIEARWLYFTWIAPVALVGISMAFARRARWAIAAVALFVIGVSPVLGLVPFTYQRYSTVADRYLYVSLLGPALALSAVLASLATIGTAPKAEGNGTFRRGAIVAVVTWLAFLGIRSFMQTGVWSNNESLFSNGLVVNPRSWVACNGMAGVLQSRISADEPVELRFKQVNESIELARHATELAPDLPEGYILLGNAYNMLGRSSDAISSYSAAVAVAPDRPEALNCLGGTLAQNHQEARAEPLFRKAISINPEMAQAHLNLGTLLGKRNGPGDEEAFREVQLAVRLDGGDPKARMNYAAFLDARGAHAEAAAQKQMAHQLDPSLH